MKIGRYQILEEIGRGAMGVVYRAHDPQIDRYVALKILRKDRVSSEQILKRFLKEARAIGRLSHPNIVTVYDAGQDQDGTIYIAEEFIEGQPLNLVMQENQLDLNQKVNIGIRLAEAVHYAHDKGIIHRDLKPANVLLADEGQVKIMDFGIAHVEDPSATQQTQAGEILGTPAYIAPELLSGKKVDGRSDLYAIGVILYELVTGDRPFQGATMAEIFRSIIQDDPKSPLKINSDLPKSLSQVILKCLHKKPDARYQTGEALANALVESFGKSKTEIKHILAMPLQSRLSRIFVWIVLLGTVGGMIYYILPDSTLHRSNKKQVESVAVLQVDSDPPGAQLYIMGDYKGHTPLDLYMPLGDYKVSLTMEGHYNWEKEIQLKQIGKTPLFVKMSPIIF